MKHLLKNQVISAVRHGVRAYVLHAPWTTGKSCAQRVYEKYIAWRPHREIVRTRYGDLMEIALPDIISSRIYITGEWEAAITRYVRSSLRRGDVFIDVGANIGYYSIMASHLVGPTGRVFAIEASRGIFGRLTRNIEINGCTNVTAIHAAASDRNGELEFFLGDNNNLGHSTTVRALASREGMTLEDRVSADTIEQLVGAANLRRARLIKIDVEGAERIVLAPIFASLSDFSDTTEWLLELSPEFSAGGQADVNEIFEAFTAAGYRLHAIRHAFGTPFAFHESNRIERVPLSESPRERLCEVLSTRRDPATFES